MCLETDSSTSTSPIKSYSGRLQTFKNWKGFQNPEQLALAGFYYFQSGDTVQCYKCGISVHSWEPHDNPLGEHLKWAPHCTHAHNVLNWFTSKTELTTIKSALDVAMNVVVESKKLLTSIDASLQKTVF